MSTTENDRLDLSIVIPCYNESESLPQLFSACAAAIPEDLSVEVVFVDNGSTDDSAPRLAALAATDEFSFARIVTVPENRGYGHGIMAGVFAATGEVIAWTHADLQTDPADVIAAYHRYRDRLHAQEVVVKGRRIGRSALDAFFTAGMSALASTMLGCALSDINAQPKMFHRGMLEKLGAAPEDFSLDVYLLFVARREGLKILEHPVVFGDRQHGEAKGGGSLTGKWKLTKRTMAFLGQLRREIKEGRR